MNSTSYITENWYWMVAAAASGGLLLWQQLQQGMNGGGISPAQAVQMINREKGQVIDVCNADEFAAAHVAGAKNVPLGDLATAKGLPGNKKLPLVVVCASGMRSAKAVAQLKTMGYENAHSLAGGLKAWREANLPIDKA
jgi:rhodanese-related sulfurtransferase